MSPLTSAPPGGHGHAGFAAEELAQGVRVGEAAEDTRRTTRRGPNVRTRSPRHLPFPEVAARSMRAARTSAPVVSFAVNTAYGFSSDARKRFKERMPCDSVFPLLTKSKSLWYNRRKSKRNNYADTNCCQRT